MQKTIAILLGFLMNTPFLNAQNLPAFNITHYTNENGLPQSSAEDVELDKNGFLWIATEGGLVRFDGQKFRLYDREHYPVLASNRILLVRLARDNTVCFKDEYDKTYAIDSHGQPVYISEKNFKDRINPPGLCFFRVRDKKAFYVRAQDERVLWSIPLPDGHPDTKGGYGIADDKLYYCNTNGGISCIDEQKNIKRVTLKGAIGKGLASDLTPYKLLRQGDRLYILKGSQIYHARPTGKHELTCTLELTTGNIPGIKVYHTYPELNLKVVGSITHGLYLFREKQFKTLNAGSEYQNFYPQVPFQDSGVITHNGVVFPYSSYHKALIKNSDIFRSLLLDSRKHYWANDVFDSGHYIVELDAKLNLIRKLRTGDEAISCFGETPDGRLWVSSYQGNQIGTLAGDSVKWLNTPLHHKSIITFLPVNNEAIWIGGDKTLARLNVHTGKQTHFKVLEFHTIEALYQDAQKVLWIGTTGNGFFALRNDKVYSLPLDQKGYLKNTHTFLEDKSGFIWMSTNNGLFRCRKKELLDYIDKKIARIYYQYFSKESGFNTNEFNGSCTPSGIILKDGKFSLPSMDGLVQFYPDSLKEESLSYHIFLDKLSVDGKEQSLNQPLVLDPSFKRLEIALSAPFYGHPDNQLVEYNLEGFDNNWYRVKNDNVIVLNTLAYGKYTLQFRKRSGFTLNNEVLVKSLAFTVTPFFYQTWFFKIGVCVLFLAGIWFFMKARYAYLTKSNRHLEEEVNARTISLRNANRLKEKMLLMVSHDLQSPLHFLGYLSQLNYDAVHVKQTDTASEISLEIKNTSRKIISFVDEFKLWARVQDEAFNLRSEKISLRPMLEELLTFFKELTELNGNNMFLNVAEGIVVHTNRPLLKAILRNILDNANKNTRNGSIAISCSMQHENKGTITITDTGKGMSSEELQKIEHLMSRAKEGISVEPDSSLGFQFIVDFASRIHAVLEIQSTKGKGTFITLKNLNMPDTKAPESLTLQESHKLKQA